MAIALSHQNALAPDAHAALSNDDLVAPPVQRISGTQLQQWMEHNILHALVACPKAVRAWERSLPLSMVPKYRAHFISNALAGIDDDAKMAIVEGRTQDPVELELHRFIHRRAQHWASLSPVWAGAPGSALRDAAMSARWTPTRLPNQIASSIHRADAPLWSSWVVYPYSILVYQRLNGVEYAESSGAEPLAPLERTTVAWANPKDVALAQCLSQHAPTALDYTLTVHPAVPTLNAVEQVAIERLVSIQVQLGGWDMLKLAILNGELPGEGHALPSLALPDLGAIGGMQ